MRTLLLATTVVGACAATIPAIAQTAATATVTARAGATTSLQEITVTAERRKQTEQRTAASISVRTGAELLQQGRYTTAQILEDVPGVTTGGGSGDDPGAGITIRGMSANTEPARTSSVPATAVYVDGIYGGIGGNYDISRVEVLRGPQGTLYGRSATGGVVSTYTNDPQLGKYGADVLLEYGSYDLRHATVAVNVPIGSALALRVAGNEYDQLGFISLRGGSNEETDARAKLLYQPTPDISALIGWAIEEQHSHSGGDSLVVGSSSEVPASGGAYQWTKESASIYPSEDHMRQYWGNFNWTTPVGTLTYIPAFHTYYLHGQQLIGNVIRQDNLEPYDQFLTQEVRLTSLPDSPVSWVAGALYYDNALTNSTITHWIYSGALTFDQQLHKQTHDEGGFADAIVPIGETWKVTGGVRFDHTGISTDESYTANNATPVGNPYSSTWFLPEDDVTSTLSGPAGARNYNNFTFRARVEKDFTPRNLVYGLISTGFLPGDVALSKASTGPVAIPYAQERLTAYEIGSKNRFLDNSLQIDGDLYYYHYSGFQQTVNTSGNPGNPSFATLTSPARMEGGELEALYQLTPFDRASLGYAYINAYFVNQPAEFVSYQAQTRIPGIAPNTFNITYDHTLALPDGSTLDLRDQVRYASGYDLAGISVSEADYGSEPYVHVNDTWVDDINLTWQSPNRKYSVSGYVNNLGNSVYKAGAALSIADSGGVEGTVTTSAPRVVGVVLHASY